MCSEIVTSTNNAYCFTLIYKDKDKESFKSKEYPKKAEGISAFINAFNAEKDKISWGQFICHHHKDEWQNDISAVMFTLCDSDF